MKQPMVVCPLSFRDRTLPDCDTAMKRPALIGERLNAHSRKVNQARRIVSIEIKRKVFDVNRTEATWDRDAVQLFNQEFIVSNELFV